MRVGELPSLRVKIGLKNERGDPLDYIVFAARTI